MSVNDKEKPFVEYDTNVSINIPPKTTIAYSVIELEVAHTGHYGKSFLLNLSLEVLYQLHSRSAFLNSFCLRNQIYFEQVF